MDACGSRRLRPVVVVVGASTKIVEVCAEASAIAAAARVKERDVGSVPTMAAKWRPLAIVVAEPAYEADPDQLEALARDGRRRLVILSNEEVTTEELQARLLTAVAQAERMRTG